MNGETHEQPRGGKSTAQPRGRGDAEEPFDLPDEVFELPDEEESEEEPAEYELVLLNDDTHTFEYVIAMLSDLFDLPWNEGFELTLNIHEWGQAVVFKGTLQSVMQKRAQVLAYGPNPRVSSSTGPLEVEIYEAE